MSHILTQLNWRYAVKEFDNSQKLSSDQSNLIMEAFRLSPSSFGLQGWKFIHVVDPTVRQKLKEASWGQSKVTDASDFFVLTVPTNYSSLDIDKFINLTAAIRNQKVEDLAKYKEMLNSGLTNRSPEETIIWLKKQVYIALGFTIAVCANESIDSCPMEGFDPVKYDEILDLKSKNLTSVVCLAVGFRSANDQYAAQAKVRFPQEEVFLTI